MKSNARSKTAKENVSSLTNHVGGPLTFTSPSEVPRYRRHAHNASKNIFDRKRCRSTGSPKTPAFNELLGMMQTTKYLKDVNIRAELDGVTRLNTFSISNTNLQWLKAFCQGTKAKSQAGIDLTFKLGPFYATTLTFPNPMFVYASDTSKHPTTLAAFITHVSKDIGVYEYFARMLRENGVTSLTYGTDGECVLETGFENVYRIEDGKNIHLRCFNHIDTDMKQQLKGLVSMSS